MSKVLVFLLVLILLISCSETNKIVNQQPAQLAYQFSDYIKFDTTDAYVLAKSFNGKSFQPEHFLYWEEIIGEPFTDVNGNGVYDQGIDIFIKSLGSDNMDLNFDGVHSGPDDPWSIGVPFDDLNRNGICETGYRVMRISSYVDGSPYYDFNNNGVWDSITTYDCQVIKCDETTEGLNTSFSFNIIDSSMTYTSDSNITYNLRIHFISQMFPRLRFDFLLSDSGSLKLRLDSLGSESHIEMLSDINNISSDSSYLQSVNRFPIFTDTLFREIIIDAELEYKDSLYTELLLFRISYYDWSKSMDVSLEIYFAQELGLIALHDFHFINRNYDQSLYFIEKTETVPIVLTR